jgi:hypothetical protein
MVTVCAAMRPVDRYVFEWGTPGGHSVPTSSSFGSPYVGNGDIGVAYSAPSGANRLQTGEQVLSLGKLDFWTSEGKVRQTTRAVTCLFAFPRSPLLTLGIS